MILYHDELIPILPRQFLLQLHRTCCGLRGRGWNRKHKKLNYVLRWEHLFQYHEKVINEMKTRGYKPNNKWLDFYYRGKYCSKLEEHWTIKTRAEKKYEQHNDNFLKACIDKISIKLNQDNSNKYNQNEKYNFFSFIKNFTF